jgi:hypothetical protein
VEGALRGAGFEVRIVRAAPGFARLAVTRGLDQTEVGLAADARLFPSEPGPLVRSLTGRELAVDKVVAVFGRAEARDFVDLMAVEKNMGWTSFSTLPVKRAAFYRASLPKWSLGSSAFEERSLISTLLVMSGCAEPWRSGAKKRLVFRPSEGETSTEAWTTISGWDCDVSQTIPG